MGFSIRSLFQKDSTSSADEAQGLNFEFGQQSPFIVESVPVGSASSPPAPPSGMDMQPSPFANPLFKTSVSESLQGHPVTSPFAAPGQSPSGLLTVGDVLPQLPPDIARAGSVAPDQPIHIGSHTIEAALSSGQAAVPIFEIYRVCPAIFQTPVSPQDPRLVPLPPAKIPALIAVASSAGSNQTTNEIPAMPMTTGSPFGQNMGLAPGATPFGSPAAASTPFGAVPPSAAASAFGAINPPAADAEARTPTPLPPKRPAGTAPPSLAPGLEGLGTSGGMSSPFSMPSVPAADASSSEQRPPSPFAAASDQAPMPSASASPSLFGTPPALQPTVFGSTNPIVDAPADAQPHAPFSIPASPFAAGPIPGSPDLPPSRPIAQGDFSQAFPFAPQTAPQPPSAHSPFQPTTGASQPASPSIFGMTGLPPSAGQSEPPSLSQAANTQAAAPGTPQPAPMPEFSKPTPAPVFDPPEVPAQTFSEPPHGRLCLSAALKGYGQGDLGIDPNMIPSWITTQVQAGQFRRSDADGSWLVELGALVDGVTDVGFRNLLAGARRNFIVAVVAEASATAPVPQTPTQAPAPNSAFTVTPGRGQTINPMAAEPLRAESAPSPAPVEIKTGNDTPFQQARTIVQPAPGAHFGFPGASSDPLMQPAAPPPQPPASQATPAELRPMPVAGFDPFAAPAGLWSAPTSSSDSDQGGLSSEQLFGTPPKSATPNPAPEPPARKDEHAVFQPSSAAEVAKSTIDAPKPETTPLPPLSALPEIQMPPMATPSPPVPAFSAPVDPLVDTTQPRRKDSPLLARLAESTPPATKALEPISPIPSAPTVAAPQSEMTQAHQAPVEAPKLNFSPPIGTDDQLLLRALLGVDERLSPQRVVELTAALSGISACALVMEGTVLTGGRATKTAQDFQQQAGRLAGGIRSLAPLIGIADAETFTLNAQDRLITFCFPEGATMGVLHEDLQQPAAGLRDKVTLIARELAKMVKA